MRALTVSTGLALAACLGCGRIDGGSRTVVPVGADLMLRIGNSIPQSPRWTDEQGRPGPLQGRPGRATILSLNYYECKGICSPMLTNLSKAIEKLQLEPGVDYQVWTVSIDSKETPAMALRKKRSIFAAMHRPIPESSWTFFTADGEQIARLADSVGFRFSRQGDGFMHPGALIILAPDGRIVRYIYGNTYLSLDLEMALIEAAHGTIGQTYRKSLLMCFRDEPMAKSYVYLATRTGGVALLAGIVASVIVSRRRRRGAV